MTENMKQIMVLCAAIGCVAPSVAHAHLGSTKAIDVSVTAGRVRVDVTLDVADARALGGLDPEGAPSDALARRARVGEALARGIHVRGVGPCALAPVETRAVDRGLRVRLEAPCDVEGALVLEDTTIFPDDPRHEAIVHVRGRARTVAILRRGRQRVTLPMRVETSALLVTFLASGAAHFATGYDHVLFLLTLLLPFGRSAARGGRRATLGAVAVVVTAFTLGHSATLALAALDVLRLPSQAVEVAIALSIVAVALVCVVRPRSRAQAPYLALVFGLVHGLGFSSVLDVAELGARAKVFALLAFNVGIELAQLAFVAVAAPLLFAAARHASYERVVVRGGGIVIAGLGLLLVLERLA